MKTTIRNCQCGKKASKKCLRGKCFKCCERSKEHHSIVNSGDANAYICKYHEVYRKNKDKYRIMHNPIVLNQTTPDVDKIKKPRKKMHGKNILVKISKNNNVSDQNKDQIIKTIETIMNLALKKHFKKYSARINIKIDH